MKKYTKKTYKTFWKHIKKYKINFFAIIFCVIAANILEIITPIYFKDFFDVLASGGEKGVVTSSMLSILLVISVIKVMENFFWTSSSFLTIRFQPKIMVSLLNDSFAYLQKHSSSFFENDFTGALVRRVNNFSRSFETISDIIFFNLISVVVSSTGVFFVLFNKNLWLGMITLFWLIFFMIINIVFSKFRYKYDIENNEKQSNASGYLADVIANNSNVKLFNAYTKESKGYAKLNEKVKKIMIFMWNIETFFEFFQKFLMFILEISLLYISIKLWEKGLFTVGDFILIHSYVFIIIMSMWGFGRTIRRFYKGLSDAEEMSKILDTPHEIKDIKNAKKLKVKNGEINFKDVTFCYNDTRQVISKLDLNIKAGEKIALIGPSGAGKSTIIKLLLRNHDLSSGKISVDNQNISKITQESLWNNISLVPQDSILFHRSLMENIKYGKFNASNKEAIQASKFANAHDFIKDLDMGYKTLVGERGVKLSGGERQRIAIARAVLKNSKILILDEATSSLDSYSEKLIQNALDKLMKNKTVIIIAHRLSTIKKVDRIIFIDEKGIREEGTHDELVQKKNGYYRKLWEVQAGGFIQ